MKRVVIIMWLCALCISVQAQTDKGVSSTGQLGSSGDTRSFVDEKGHIVANPRLMRVGKIIDVTLPAVTTSAAGSITTTTAVSGGNVTADGGAVITARGVCWSTNHYPTIADNHTTDGTGTGEYTSTLTGLQGCTHYYVRAYATNSLGTSYGAEEFFTTEVAEPTTCPGVATVTDYEGHVYNTVQIGEQCWMRENLYTTHYPNGSSIATSNLQVPNHNDALIPTFGYLYQWSAVLNGATSSEANPSGVQGICPNGWHVPSYAELTQLVNYVKGVPCYNPCTNKALVSQEDWNTTATGSCVASVNPELNNKTGFSLKPAGHTYGAYNENFGIQAFLWSCTQGKIENGLPYVPYMVVENNISTIDLTREVASSQYLSVRCILD
ncbi:MAG: fibrobacter succinogenes major paralogous domain-containing protein [Bacteroidales bacterium]|nr:fibrobacter succinogenes major paralogous domain-containing protein [Bacteroidales bacterium]